ncbi:MAG: hypothetical protein U0R19_38840 [Bryobacteraceae bacterium]
MLRSLLFLGMAVLTACGGKTNNEQARLEAELEKTLTGAVLAGKFQMGERVHEDKYTISKASKLAGETWMIQSRIQYGTHDVTVPIPITIKWAGDTPVLTLTDAGIPGMGKFTARILIYRGNYAGYWANDKGHGGQMWGTVSRAGN